jgi:hypothetical protein
MDMIALQADVYDPHALSERRDDRCLAHCLVHLASAQSSDVGNDTQHDMQRVPRLHLAPRVMRRARPAALWLASGALPLAALLEQLLLYMPLTRSPRSSSRHQQ